MKGYSYQGKFEFELKNGKGKGKKYFESFYYSYDDILIGEYLDGEINGKGEIYRQFYNETLPVKIFEGEYLNGKKM